MIFSGAFVETKVLLEKRGAITPVLHMGQLGERVPTVQMQVLIDMKRGRSTFVNCNSLPRSRIHCEVLFVDLSVGSHSEVLAGELSCIFFPQVSRMNKRGKQHCSGQRRTGLQCSMILSVVFFATGCC